VGLAAEQELAGDRRSEAFAAWRRFFESLAEERPLVLVFEDLHWADEGLLDFVDYLVDWASGVPLLAACTARPELLERRPGWGGGKRNAVTVSLSPLSEEDTARLVSALLDQAVLPAETQTALLAHAGGNPLYAEEYIRMLQDRGFLRRAGSAWHLERTEELPLPESVQGIIAARLDALSPEEKSLLQDAAVAGKVAWVGALATISDTPRWEVEERLHALERKEFLIRDRRSSVAGETQYVFRHVLVRDVAYNQIPRADRVEKHRAAAEWLESLPADRSEDRAEMLAHHYSSALELAQATGKDASALAEPARLALREAGDRAAALNAFDAAARFYQRAVELSPDPGPHLLLAYGRSLSWASSTGGDVLERARAGLVELGEREAAAEAETLLGEFYWVQGQRDPASEHLRSAAELIAGAPASLSKAYVLAQLSRFHMLASENDEAIRVGREALEMAEQLGLDELRANALNNIGISRTLSGDLAGLEDLEASIAIAESINSPESIRGYGNLGSILGDVGELDRAWTTLAQAREAAARFGFAEPLRWQTTEQVGEWYYTARWSEAVELADRLIVESEESVHWMEPVLRRIRAQMRMGRGDLRGALEDVEKAVEFVRVAKDPQLVYPVLACASRVYCAARRHQEAGTLLDELLVPRGEGRGYVDSEWTADAAVALAELARPGDLQPVAAPPTPWLEAALAYLRGDFAGAADRYAKIGSLPDEAYSRLRAAGALIEARRRPEGEGELERALAFYREVGATRYIAEAESLLAASA
jgi:tetratricopeptide (TPR) repeat protein